MKASPRRQQNQPEQSHTVSTNLSPLNLSPRFIKSNKDQKKVTKVSKHHHYQNEHHLEKKRHKRRNHHGAKKQHADAIIAPHKYKHDHHVPSEFRSERFQPGYSSEPDVIEYSLDRSWINSHSNYFNQSLPDNMDVLSESDIETSQQEEVGITNTFQSRHFVKLPKLVYYNGQNHYSRANKLPK